MRGPRGPQGKVRTEVCAGRRPAGAQAEPRAPRQPRCPPAGLGLLRGFFTAGSVIPQDTQLPPTGSGFLGTDVCLLASLSAAGCRAQWGHGEGLGLQVTLKTQGRPSRRTVLWRAAGWGPRGQGQGRPEGALGRVTWLPCPFPRLCRDFLQTPAHWPCGPALNFEGQMGDSHQESCGRPLHRRTRRGSLLRSRASGLCSQTRAHGVEGPGRHVELRGRPLCGWKPRSVWLRLTGRNVSVRWSPEKVTVPSCPPYGSLFPAQRPSRWRAGCLPSAVVPAAADRTKPELHLTSSTVTPRSQDRRAPLQEGKRVRSPAHFRLGILPPAPRVYKQDKSDTKPSKIHWEGKLQRGWSMVPLIKSTTLLSTVIWHCWRFILITFNKIQSKDDCLGSLSNKVLSLITILYYQ